MVGGVDLWGVGFIYISFKLGTTSLEQSPREANCPISRYEILFLFWNTMIQYFDEIIWPRSQF
jgi:hypothetical protein